MASSSLIARLLIRTSNFLSPRSSQTLSPLLRNNDNTTNRYTIFLRQQQQQQQQHASKSYSSGAGKGDSGDDQRRYGSPLRKAGFVRERVDEGKKETRGSVAFRDVNGKNKDVFQAFDGEGQGEDEEAEEEDDEAEWEDQHQHSHLAENNQGRSEPIDPSAFGEQLALAGLTEKDLDSLIAKMDFSGIQGLPPLEEILQHDPEGEQKAKRQEMEMRKQQELAMTRVKTVDELGRAYATGRRKTSEACGWLSEGKGRIIINGKTHDIYFPSLDHRVQLLEPFCEAQTLGKFKVFSTVKGGGITEAATMQNLVGLGLSLPVASLLSSPKFASQLQHRRTFIQLKTNLEVADNSGARRVQCIKVLGGGKGARLGDTIIASVKDAAPRGKVKKGEVVYCVVVRAAMQKLRCDGSQIKFDGNAVVLVNKQLEPIGTRVFGPISAELRQRKLDKVLALAEQIA